MATWSKPLPDTAVEGEDTHVEDHNKIVDALTEVRSNIDGIELTPGQKGDKGDKGDTGAKGATGAKGDKGDPGDPGFPSEADWNALVARVQALEDAATAG